MNKWQIGLALSAAAVPATAWGQSAPEVLTRSGKWILDETPESCRLYARFGEGDAMVIARFTRFEPGEWFDLALLGDRMHSSSPLGDVKIDFGLKGEPVEASALNGGFDQWKAGFFRGLRLDGWMRRKPEDKGPAITPQQEASVSGMTVAIRGKRPFRLEFKSLAQPFAQLRACTTALVSSWGYDPQVQARLLRPVTAANMVGSWVTGDDYPMEALVRGNRALVTVRLDVDAAGAISKCNVLDRTDQEEFAKIVCRAIMKRARLKPALDERGQPVPSYMLLKWGINTGS